jgi:hypothetical protein
VSTEAEPGADARDETTTPEDYTPPSELESALLTIVMFAGLVVFALGCVMTGNFG